MRQHQSALIRQIREIRVPCVNLDASPAAAVNVR